MGLAVDVGDGKVSHDRADLVSGFAVIVGVDHRNGIQHDGAVVRLIGIAILLGRVAFGNIGHHQGVAAVVIFQRKADLPAGADRCAVQRIFDAQFHRDTVHRRILAVFDLNGDGSCTGIFCAAANASAVGILMPQRITVCLAAACAGCGHGTGSLGIAVSQRKGGLLLQISAFAAAEVERSGLLTGRRLIEGLLIIMAADGSALGVIRYGEQRRCGGDLRRYFPGDLGGRYGVFGGLGLRVR